MKLLASFFLAVSFLLGSFGAVAQTGKPKAGGPATQTLQVKTSAVCDMCKARLEKAMAYEKGVQQAQLDVASKILTVTYRPEKTTPAALRAAVQQTGYDADDQQAETRAYDRLPDCCKKTNATH